MAHFLLVYRRSTGTLERCTEYRSERSGELALVDRFILERERWYDRDLEIVVLGGESLEAIKRTHGRYFYTVSELAQQMLDKLAVGPDYPPGS